VKVERACDSTECEDWVLLIIESPITRFIHVEDKRVRHENQQLVSRVLLLREPGREYRGTGGHRTFLSLPVKKAAAPQALAAFA
jgi:hypothetical protein